MVFACGKLRKLADLLEVSVVYGVAYCCVPNIYGMWQQHSILEMALTFSQVGCSMLLPCIARTY